jgi:hypothetical protein
METFPSATISHLGSSFLSHEPQSDLAHRERNQSIHLNLRQLKNLDRELCQGFNAWVREAPDTFNDTFLATRHPVIITSLYGQNQPLSVDQEQDAEASANWSRYRNFSQIKYLTVAIATHLKSVFFLSCLLSYHGLVLISLQCPSGARMATAIS